MWVKSLEVKGRAGAAYSCAEGCVEATGAAEGSDA